MGKTDESGEAANRRRRHKNLRESGWCYPNDFVPTHHADELPDVEKAGTSESEVRVAGRIMLLRYVGKSAFATLEDVTGRIQLYARAGGGGSERSCLDVLRAAYRGDIVGASGRLFRTDKGELTVELTELRLLATCLHSLPEKYKGLADPEQRRRNRPMAFLVDRSMRDRFVARARLVRALRAFFDDRGYCEAETPMFHTIQGGAIARPFVAKHIALDMQLYLRIAPELYLKRLLVGGFEKVYELNRCFRNESDDTTHNPEFTMIEFYAAYHRQEDFMDLTEELFGLLAEDFAPSGKLKWRNHEISLASPWPRIPMADAVAEHNNLTPDQVADPELLEAKLSAKALADPKLLEAKLAAKALADPKLLAAKLAAWLGALQQKLFDETVEKKLLAPTWITGFPASVSPLARRNDSNPDVADRFELIICGEEFANGFSEQNDPQQQEEAFKAQRKEYIAGDVKAMQLDADYVEALEYGMPPAAGEGIGIDRLAMLLLGCDSIRDVLWFPAARKKKAD